MRLTQFSDYALRTLLYLRVHGDRAVPLIEIAESYGISYHHLVKVAALLGELELVTTVRGRAGGFRLAKAPGEINLGWLIRRTEPDFHLVECFDRATDSCPITPVCKLRGVLAEAMRSFLDVLDGYTLADFPATAAHEKRLVQLWADRRSPAVLAG
jgi:Rrf2 family nitric oxide-sensitive transcriptional repressor